MPYERLPYEAKFCAPRNFASRVANMPRPLVFTNGCFDILHRGHVTYLARARAMGASLVVALNSDESVRRLGKGVDRPLNPLEDRIAVIAALESVDLVTWFEEETPLARIIESRPDVLTKGGDWAIDTIVGAIEVRAWGGSVHSIPFEVERSTTTLVERIRSTPARYG
ncbi:MAG: adenylyltransferase/cytidyltransferase family protein [Betaproteobacteria bacterium]|jgi:rfaE bifunctional protein nucleotidyltransferase chain/domain|nr:adenylyltransferase/cytidyltransferase family protein [Betaproteobacteria bacterium]